MKENTFLMNPDQTRSKQTYPWQPLDNCGCQGRPHYDSSKKTLYFGLELTDFVQVYFLFTDAHLLRLQHLLAAVHAALRPVSCCECSTAYYFFSCCQSTFMQCYSVALKRLISAPVHAG